MAPTRSVADPLPEGTSSEERSQVERVREFLVAMKPGARPRARQPPSLLERLLFGLVSRHYFAPLGAAVRSAAAPRASPPASPAPLSAPRPRSCWRRMGRACAPKYPARRARSVDKSQPRADSGNQVPSQEILNCLREHGGKIDETVEALEGQLNRKLPCAHPAVVLSAVPPPRSRLRSALRACPCRLDVGGQVGQEGEEKAGGATGAFFLSPVRELS